MTAPSGPDNQDPDFSAFENWLARSADPWPWEKEKELTAQQKKIVEKNARLLLDEQAWRAHVDAFEEQLNLIKDEKKRAKRRADFHIRFDCHVFPDTWNDFSGFRFPCSVSFAGATFKGSFVWFNKATFGDGLVSFDGATFGDGLVSFDQATFGDGFVSFELITLTEASLSFRDINVGGNFFVRNTAFPQEADFQRASFKGTADFSDNVFEQVPDFRDAIFARPPEVARMEVRPYAFAPMTPWWKGETDEAAKFRKLKAMALAANDHEKDGEFFAYEMLAKRGYEKGSKGPLGLGLNWLYFTLSNFGQSYVRPLACFGISFCSFFLYYAITLGQLFITDERMTFAFWHSLRNTFPFVSSLFRFANKPIDFFLWYDQFFQNLKGQEELVKTLVNASIIQNFLGLIFLFLLFLGLRNKFRLK